MSIINGCARTPGWLNRLGRRMAGVSLTAALMLSGMTISHPAYAGLKSKPVAPQAAQQPPFTITSIHPDPVRKILAVEGFGNFATTVAKQFTVLKLTNPYRVIVDMPNTDVELSQRELTINRNGIRSVQVEQKETAFYHAARLTIFVDDADTLWRINTFYQDNALMLSLEDVPGIPGAASPLAQVPANGKAGLPPMPAQPAMTAPVLDHPRPDLNVVEDIFFRDGALTLKTRPGSSLSVKQRFVLQNPGRLVVDLDEAVVGNKELLKAIPVDSPTIRQVRVGQFDEETVRLVIETDHPESIQLIYPGRDQSVAYLGDRLDTSVSNLPADVELGVVQNISVEKQEDGSSIIRLASSVPIVHRVLKTEDRVYLDLLNLAAQPAWIPFDKASVPGLNFVKIQSLTAGQPNSKLVLELKNPGLFVDTRLTNNDRVLEVVVENPSPSVSPAGLAKAPWPARIVVDAGHGGKDNGAMRSGVLEKDLNLSLALMVRDELSKRGFKVSTTRSSDVFLPLPTISAIANKANPDIFISIHHNASVNAALNGVETYYYTGKSLALAQKVHKHIANKVDAPDRGVRRAMFYVIHHTVAPSILCEVGYVSNPGELRALQSYQRKQATASAIADGVVEYFKSRVSAQAAPGH
ncbi:MAG: N-acetylmuramoyl-L-alanine amidase [Candidatus Melainabacteria bacterium]